MPSFLIAQMESACTLLDQACDTILNASTTVRDAGDEEGAQDLEELAVTVSAAVKALCDRHGMEAPGEAA